MFIITEAGDLHFPFSQGILFLYALTLGCVFDKKWNFFPFARSTMGHKVLVQVLPRVDLHRKSSENQFVREGVHHFFALCSRSQTLIYEMGSFGNNLSTVDT